jgi:uncharacterized protein YecT (DUF1311 family)
MNRKIVPLTAFVLLLLPLAALGGHLLTDREESAIEFKQADADLNFAYSLLVDVYRKADPETEKQLKATEEAWIKYRDLAAQSENALHSKGYLYLISKSDLTRERTKRIEWALRNASSSPDCPEEIKAMADHALKTLEARKKENAADSK